MAVSNSILCQLTNIKQIVRSGNAVSNFLSRLNNYTNNVCLYSTTTAAATNETVPKEKPQKKMSKAMLAYLERAREHDMFVQNEKVAFQIGKRHLANMMGEDPEHFTQADIDRAIAYLLPSGLYDKAARPIMKPPEELFPPRKAAQFDETGRPHHTMFYTVSPHYYRMLYDIVESLQNLNNLEDNMISKGVAPDPQKQLQLQSSRWVSAPELEKILVERVDENKYDYFLSTIERLTAHPYSYQVEELIMKYRRPMQSLVTSYVIPPLEYDENGRPYVVVPDCKRKSARGQVILKGKGSGKIMINGIRLENYFDTVQSREQV